MASYYRRVETNIPVYNPEGLAEDGECRSKSGDSIVKETYKLEIRTAGKWKKRGTRINTIKV